MAEEIPSSVETPAPAAIESIAPEVVVTETASASAPAESAIEAAADPAPEVTAESSPAPIEVAPPEGEKPPETVAEVPPVYTDFTLPEGFRVTPQQLSAFTEVLGAHKLSQEDGQKFMDLHTASLKAYAEQLDQNQHDVFTETRRGWVQDFDKSAGNRRDTILNDAKWAITELVPDAKARTELWSVLAFTGAGDHKAVVNAFASAAKRLRERTAPPAGLPQNGAKTGSPADRRYGKPAS